MKVVFAGTPEFAAISLRALIDAGYEIPLVLTQPDRPAGRGLRLQPSPVKEVALAHGIPVAQPASLRLQGKHAEDAERAHALLRDIEFDVMVVVAYGLILPKAILDLPPLGCINIHASLLPRWRGAAPIQRALEAGDAETGTTIMRMDEGLDTGPMLMRQALPIRESDDAASLHDKLAALGARMIVLALGRLEKGELQAMPQPDEGVSYAAKISKDEAALDFSLPAKDLVNRIRAFNPFPGAAANFAGTLLKIWRAEPSSEQSSATPGQIIAADAEHGVLVACGNGAVRLLELQKPGAKRLPAEEFIKGFPLKDGRFG